MAESLDRTKAVLAGLKDVPDVESLPVADAEYTARELDRSGIRIENINTVPIRMMPADLNREERMPADCVGAQTEDEIHG